MWQFRHKTVKFIVIQNLPGCCLDHLRIWTQTLTITNNALLKTANTLLKTFRNTLYTIHLRLY